MSLHGINAAWRIGNDVRFAVKYGTIPWRKVHMAIGDKQRVCPFCGVPVPDARAKAIHESWEARVQVIMHLAGISDLDELPADRRLVELVHDLEAQRAGLATIERGREEVSS